MTKKIGLLVLFVFMYVLGKSGTGKSVLLSNLIVQNIQNGEGVCVVDPHGELVEEIVHLIINPLN